MFDAVLVANRGEIARRIIRSAHLLGVRCVAVYAEADRDLPFVAEADVAISLGEGGVTRTYLDADRVLQIARECGVDAIHPGYGLLSESASFARMVTGAGIAWVGPSAEIIEMMGDKAAAKSHVRAAGVPVAPGGDETVTDPDEAVRVARRIGYPVMLKPSAGGGGIGMHVADDDGEVRRAMRSAVDQSRRLFGHGGILIEQFIRAARHIEVQILGLNDGTTVVLGERDCSVQRRHQKVVEEAPASGLPDAVREVLHSAARRAGESVDYRGAGTVEFLVDADTLVPTFCEMNTRLQVEHPVTELVTGVDLVAEQFRVAAGEEPGFDSNDISPRGHAVELRVYAEDPVTFRPSPGAITVWDEPSGDGVRVDSAYTAGNTVTPLFDPLLSKLSVWAPSRDEAIDRALAALARFEIEGPKTNLPLLEQVLRSASFRSGAYDTGMLATLLTGDSSPKKKEPA